MGGKTVHSWAGVSTATESFDFYEDLLRKDYARNFAERNRLWSTDLLVFDEISMVVTERHSPRLNLELRFLTKGL